VTDNDNVGAAVTARVGSFYEQHPYPLPVENLAGYGRSWDDARRLADGNQFWPGSPYRDDRSILVAGCGTSQAAKYALRWPKAKVTGIELSEASIEQTARLKRKHGLRNLELRQLPIERAAELGGTFDHVVSTGVLHHLADPETGLRALRDVLAPDGAMHLMVYAPYGRTGVYMLQEYCRRLGIGSTAEDIRELALSLRELPPQHPLRPLLALPDFQDKAGLADALLNPQDRAYSVPQVFEFLASAGLEFGRWIRQAPYLPHCGTQVQSPHRARLAALPEAEQYAALELFRGCMVTHSFVAYPSGRAKAHGISFAGDSWLGYVPVRVPDTVMLEERIPDTAAAVLINPGHTFTDLYLPIDAPQKALFDAIDGRRSIGEIAPDAASRAIAAVLFERLWHYDQVVFDSSNGA